MSSTTVDQAVFLCDFSTPSTLRPTFWSGLNPACACLADPADSYLIESRSQHFRHSIRVQAFAEEAKAITCPISWVPITYVVEDGAKVAKDQVIVEFDRQTPEFDLGALLKERDVIEAELAHKLLTIENTEHELRDTLAALKDKLAVLEAKLQRQKSLPREDDVRIAEGRLRIARMNYDAAATDLSKGVSRFERGMISRAELDALRTEHALKQANLEYATAELEAEKLPATSGSIRKTELQIENTKLEIGKLEHELTEHGEIAAIQRKGAMARKKMIDKKIADKEEDLANTVVRSPIDGYVSHLSHRDREVEVGTKLWKNFTFMKIPDVSTLAFKGCIAESVRKFFDVGDVVTIRLYGRMDVPVEGSIKSISTLPHDLAEKDEGSWGSVGREYGIKVFDVVIAVKGEADWVRPGMQGMGELVSSKDVSSPGVPLRFVTKKDAHTYLACDGVYEEAKGVVSNGWFLLSDQEWAGKRVTMRGEFKGDDAGAEGNGGERRFKVSGELLPVDSLDVTVKDIGGWPWPKATWLIPEDTEVNEGDVVAKLDPNEIDKRIHTAKNTLSQHQSRMEELVKQRDLTRREGEFKLQTEKNQLEIQGIDTDLTLTGLDGSAVRKAVLTRDQAKIRLDELTRRLDRHEENGFKTLSPTELATLKRDKRRQELRLEDAELRLRTTLEGASAVERSQASLALRKQQVKTAVVEREIEFEDYQKARQCRRAELDVKSQQAQLDKLLQRRENMTVTSPGAGLLQYSKIWNSGVISKINVGSLVGPRFVIMSIPDLSRMYLRVEVPEKYYDKVAAGLKVDVHIPAITDKVLTGTVESIDLLFENREKKDSQVGMYSSHEPLGEVIFKARITVESDGVQLKPGAIGEVFFPFNEI